MRLLSIGGELGYRVTTHAEPRQLVGYFTTLRAPCEAGHRFHLLSHGPQMDSTRICTDLSSNSKARPAI